MTKRLGILLLLLAGAACERSQVPSRPAARRQEQLTTESALREATAGLPKTASDHEKTAALVLWMAATFARGSATPARGLSGLYQDLTYSPVGAVIVMKALTDALHLRSKVIVIDKVPHFGWYPLLEIYDDDGDHMWDPYAGRFAPDYDETPLSFERSMQAVKIRSLAFPNPASYQTGDNGIGPAFSVLKTLPVMSLSAARASEFETLIHFFSDDVVFEVGQADQSSLDIESAGVKDDLYIPAFSAAGDVVGPLGTYTLAHRYTLSGMEPGKQYVFQFGLVEGSKKDLLVISSGVTGTSIEEVDGVLRARFDAAQSNGSVVLGAINDKRVRFDYLQWYGEQIP